MVAEVSQATSRNSHLSTRYRHREGQAHRLVEASPTFSLLPRRAGVDAGQVQSKLQDLLQLTSQPRGAEDGSEGDLTATLCAISRTSTLMTPTMT